MAFHSFKQWINRIRSGKGVDAKASRKRKARRDKSREVRPLLEVLEDRLAKAMAIINTDNFAVSNAPSSAGVAAGGPHAVVFFESSVANYQVLEQGLGAGTDAVVLDSRGDGVREMAAFLANRHDLSSVQVVAHGTPGGVSLGTALLDSATLPGYASALTTIGAALGPGGSLDLWSCDVAAGLGGRVFVTQLASDTGTPVAAASHPVGSAAEGGSWSLDDRIGVASVAVPFQDQALARFSTVLSNVPQWGAGSNMLNARTQQTATLLPNNSGQVLVVGGSNGNNVGVAELYTPGPLGSPGTWSPTGSGAPAVWGATATYLPNSNQVLVAGGYDNQGNALQGSWLYSPGSNGGSWTFAGNMTAARAEFTATLLSNGWVLAAGGNNNASISLATAEVYEGPGNGWVPTGNMHTARSEQAATVLQNGQVLVAGGVDNNGSSLSSAELYTLGSGWSLAGTMPSSGGATLNATLLNNGQVLVTGTGTSTSLYSGGISWSSGASMASGHSGGTATLLKQSGQVLVTGGVVPGIGYSPSTELYTPGSGWSSGGNMATGREYQTATLLQNGEVLVAGGYTSTGATSKAELFLGTAPSITSASGTPLTAGTALNFTVMATGYPSPTFSETGAPSGVSLNSATGALSALSGTLTTSGSYPFTITANNGATPNATQSFTLTVNPGAVNLSKSTVTISAATIMAGSTATITLTAKDAFGNQETTGGLAIAFGLSGGASPSNGTPGSVIDNHDGTYTAIFTGTTARGTATVTATIGGSAVTSTLPTITVTPGPASAVYSTVSVDSNNVQAGHAVKVTLAAKDAYNNFETAGGAVVAFFQGGGTGAGTFSAVTDVGDGSYTALFTSTAAGPVTIDATIGGTELSTNAAVTVTDFASIAPSQLTIVAGQSPPQSAIFTATSASAGDSVAWEVDTGSGFEDLPSISQYSVSTSTPSSGGTSSTLTISGATLVWNNYVYQAFFTPASQTTSLPSGSAVLNVDGVTSQPANQYFGPGGDAAFTAQSKLAGDTVQWLVIPPGGQPTQPADASSGPYSTTTTQSPSGGTTSTLTITGTTADMAANEYEAVFSIPNTPLSFNTNLVALQLATIWDSDPLASVFEGTVMGTIGNDGHVQLSGDAGLHIGAFTLGMHASIDLNPGAGVYSVDVSTPQDINVFVASLGFSADATWHAGSLPQLTVSGFAAISGPLAKILQGSASFTLGTNVIKFDGTLGIPNVPGASFDVHATVDGFGNLTGIPGLSSPICYQCCS